MAPLLPEVVAQPADKRGTSASRRRTLAVPSTDALRIGVLRTLLPPCAYGCGDRLPLTGRRSPGSPCRGEGFPLESVGTVYGLGTVMLVPLEFCGAASGSWFAAGKYVGPAPVRLVTEK